MFQSPLPMFSLPTDEPRPSAAVRSGPFRRFGWAFICLCYITWVLPTRHVSPHSHKPPRQSACIGHVPRVRICTSCFHQLLHGISGLIPVSISFSLLSDHSSVLSSFPLQLVDATMNFKTNSGHGEASLNAEFSRLPDPSTCCPDSRSSFRPSTLSTDTQSQCLFLPQGLTMGAGDTWPRGAVTEGALALYSIFPLCLLPHPRNQKCFPNPKHPREWGLVKKLLTHQDKYVYSVFDALSLGETNCTLERAMERWTQPSTTCQNCIK